MSTHRAFGPLALVAGIMLVAIGNPGQGLALWARVVCSMLGAFSIGWFAFQPLREHRHKYVATAVTHEKFDNDGPMIPSMFAGPPRAKNVTHVLLRCACGDIANNTLNGTWMLAQLLGSSPGESVDAFLATTKETT